MMLVYLVTEFSEESVDIVHVPIFSMNETERERRLSISHCCSFMFRNLFLKV